MRLKDIALTFITFAIITILFTWPLTINLSKAVYGYPGDNFGYIYTMWWWKYAKVNNLSFNYIPFQEAPVGAPVSSGPGTIAFLWPTYALTWVFDEVTSFNLSLLLTFPLTGLFTYLLAYKVTKNKAASFLAGLVFAFSPYHIWKSYNHLDLSMIHWFPLYFWGFFNLLEKKTLKSGVLSGLFYSLIILTNFYYAYFAFFATLMLGVVWILRDLRDRKQKLNFLSGYLPSAVGFSLLPIAVALLIVLPSVNQMKTVNSERQGDLFKRPLENLIYTSGRPWDYLLPSEDHPVFGKISKQIYTRITTLSNDWKTQSTYVHEKTAFVGYFSLFFSLFAFVLFTRKKLKNQFLVPLIVTIFGLVLLAAPPYIYIGGIKILFPSYFLYQIFPMFRAYSRLGVLATLFVSIIGAIGFSHLNLLPKPNATRILRSEYARGISYIIVVWASMLILFEFANFPPAKITYIEPVPEVYQWLKEQPGNFVIMEYPKLVNLSDIELYQRYHLKGIANPRDLSPRFVIWKDVENLFSKKTPENLKKIGVKYVIVHRLLLFDTPNPVDDMWHMRAYNQNTLDYSKLPKGFKLIKTFEKEDVLEVL